MQISVVNLSKRISDEQALEVIRAINRQVNEDFAPYWHLAATLRLEGSAKRLEDRGTPALLRGEAVLYLDDDPKSNGVEGFHQSNGRGLPFGVVYTQIAEKLDGTWTITMSHEALELIADPTVNTLAAGPHPVERTRHVFHWLEVCDPVQADSYRIDGVAVSSFVLPAYFDPTERAASERRDFLGTRAKGGGIGPFAIAPGGYVTFFDPRTLRNESVDADQEATRRRRLKEEHQALRRATRRLEVTDRSASPAPRLAAAESRSTPSRSSRSAKGTRRGSR
jgi:hypothetical protein